MDIIGSRIGQTSVVALSGALNTSSAPHLLVRAIALCDTGIRMILIDLDQVPYVTSSGFRSLIQVRKRAEQSGVGIALCGLNEVVFDLFDVSGMLDIFHVYSDRVSALAAIGQPGAS